MLTKAAANDFISHPKVQNFLLGLILLNAVVLGLETSPTVVSLIGPLLRAVDLFCLVIFVAEILLKLYARGFGFFRSGWNVFDFLVVGVSLVPGGEGASVLRGLRVLRLLRVLSVSPTLRRVIDGLLRALPGMGAIVVLIGIIFYISAVMATKLFGAAFPVWFGTLGASLFTLFEVMTLDGWSSGVVRPIMEVYPYAWAFFLPFVMVTSFAVLNLLVGLVVNTMQEAATSDEAFTKPKDAEAYQAEILARLAQIEARLGQNAGSSLPEK